MTLRPSASEPNPVRRSRRLLALLAFLVWCGAEQPSRAAPLAFDCDLATRRIDAVLQDMGRDARQHEELKASIATREGRMVTERQAYDLRSSQRLAAYIEKIVPQKAEDVQKKAEQAHARDCIAEDRLQAILRRSKAEQERVIGPEPRS